MLRWAVFPARPLGMSELPALPPAAPAAPPVPASGSEPNSLLPPPLATQPVDPLATRTSAARTTLVVWLDIAPGFMPQSSSRPVASRRPEMHQDTKSAFAIGVGSRGHDRDAPQGVPGDPELAGVELLGCQGRRASDRHRGMGGAPRMPGRSRDRAPGSRDPRRIAAGRRRAIR